MPFTNQHKRWLAFILASYFLLGISYMLATPPLEASDEYKHYPVVQTIQNKRALPVLDPDDPGMWQVEAAQPPLYYILMAGLTTRIDTGDLPELHQVNKHAYVGNPNQILNKNIMIHQPQREQFPWQGTVLAVYVIRIASLLLGMITIMLTAYLGKQVHSPPTGILAATLTAFTPMFLFVSAAVNNDVLANLLGTAGTILLVYLWQQAPDPRQKWGHYALIGLLLGLGILTKLSLGGLMGLAGLVLAWQSWRQKRWELFFIGGPILLVVSLAVSGWWFVRNVHFYNDLTALNVFVVVQGVRDEPIRLAGWINEFGTLYRSYWGLFGGLNVAAPEWMFNLYNLAMIVGFAGLLKYILAHRSSSKPSIIPLLLWTAVIFALLVRWNVIYTSFQGRLLFPAQAGINVLWAIGVFAWIKEEWQQRTILGISGVVFVIAAMLPWTVIRPAYVYPQPLTAVPPTAQYNPPFTFTAGDDVIQLVGAEMAPGQSIVAHGEPVELVLYWEAVTDIDHDYLSTVHLLGRNLESVGSVNRFPGWGMVPTSKWQTGQIWRDEYHIYADKDAVAPARLQVRVSLYDAKAGLDLPAAIDQSPVELVLVGEARLGTERPLTTTPPHPLSVDFAEGISFTGYALTPAPAVAGDDLTIELFWQANGTPSQAYTVFVQLLGADGTQLAGADAPPLNNDYPTNFWQSGDVIVDPHVMQLPASLEPGSYQLVIGLYEPDSGVRVPRLDGDDRVQWTIQIE